MLDGIFFRTKTVNGNRNLEFLLLFLDIQLPDDTDEVGISLE